MTINLIMAKQANKLDGAIKQKAFTFLEKLTTDDTMPGLHIEPIHNSADPRVRTGRVDKQYRAVLFKLVNAGDTTYVFHGIWNHDDAIAVAQKTVLALNPANGMPEIRELEQEREAAMLPPLVAAATPRGEPSPAANHDHPEKAEPFGLHASRDELVQVLGLPADLADQVMVAPSEEALLALQDQLMPQWQQLALVGLGAGMTVHEVLDDLDLHGRSSASDTPVSDEEMVEHLNHPSARIEFAQINGRDELRRVIEGGDFAAWRVFLHPEQATYASKPFNGAFRLSGGAGTGKTVVVLHRTRMLLDRDPAARVVATTYTVNLASALDRDLTRLDPDLPHAAHLGQPGAYIGGIDSIARQVLKLAGSAIAEASAAVLGSGRTDLVSPTPSGAWRQAMQVAGGALPAHLKSARFFEDEYALVVLPNRITAKEDYLRVRRPGRGVRLGVGGGQVHDTRVMGGFPLRALWPRSVL